MNKLIDNAVNRFLAWKLPKDFGPDCGISFDGRGKDARGYEKTWPVGTNLFTAEQARAMFEYCLTPAAETTKDNAGIAQSVVRPTPLYTIGGQGHVAAARCSDRSIASSEATCLNTGPSARIGTDTQHGKLDADAGSIPAPPTTSSDPDRDELVRRLRQTPHAPMCPGRWPDVAYNCQCQHRSANEAAARIQSDAERIIDLGWSYEGALIDTRHAEAENAKLRRVVKRAHAVMHGDGVMDQGQAWDECVRVLDAALKELDAP